MSLSDRKLPGIISVFLSALFLALGVFLMFCPEALQFHAMTYATTMTDVTTMTAVTLQGDPDASEETTAEGPVESTTVQEIMPDTTIHLPIAYRFPQWSSLAAFLLLLGAGLAVAGLFLFRDTRAGIGPEGAVLLMAAGFLLAVFTSYRINPYTAGILILLLFLGACGVLFGLRKLVGWFFLRCDPAWPLIVRLSERRAEARGKDRLRIVYPAVIFAALAALFAGTLVWLLISARRDGTTPYVLLIAEAALAAIAFAAMIHGSRRCDEIRNEAVEKARISERFRVDLIANVSHDIRTPLTSILGYGELLEKENLSADGREDLALLNRKAAYMKDLVDSLFELTKVSSGVLKGKEEQIDLIRLLEQTIGFFDDQLTARGLTVKRHYCAGSIPLVSDGTFLNQIFANLLSNAIKYSLGGTRIFLSVTKAAQRVMVRMTNTASYEMDFSANEIVERFVRGDKSRTGQGSGLGLAIARTYTEALGGEFRVEIDGDQFNAFVELKEN